MHVYADDDLSPYADESFEQYREPARDLRLIIERYPAALGQTENGQWRWECACGAVVRDYQTRLAATSGLVAHYRNDLHLLV